MLCISTYTETSLDALTACVSCSQPPEISQSPDLFSSETYEWEAIQNLDQFFVRVYRSGFKPFTTVPTCLPYTCMGWCS